MVDIESPTWQKNLFVGSILSFVIGFILIISFVDLSGCYNCENGYSPFTDKMIKGKQLNK